VWFGLWLSAAKEKGFDDSGSLSPEDAEKAISHAREWLSAHPDAVTTTSGLIAAPEGITEQELQRPHAMAQSMLSLWIVLLGVGAAWAGRNAFTEDFEPGTFPGLALSGMRRLVRKDRFATVRIAAGLLIMTAVGVLIALLIAVHFHDRAVGKLICG